MFVFIFTGTLEGRCARYCSVLSRSDGNKLDGLCEGSQQSSQNRVSVCVWVLKGNERITQINDSIIFHCCIVVHIT